MVGREGLENRRIVWITLWGSVTPPSADGNRKPGAPQGQYSGPTKVRRVPWQSQELKWEMGGHGAAQGKQSSK